MKNLIISILLLLLVINMAFGQTESIKKEVVVENKGKVVKKSIEDNEVDNEGKVIDEVNNEEDKTIGKVKEEKINVSVKGGLFSQAIKYGGNRSSNLLMGGIGLKILPKTWNISLGFSGSMQGSNGDATLSESQKEQQAYEGDLEQSQYKSLDVRLYDFSFGKINFGYQNIIGYSDIFGADTGRHILDFKEKDPTHITSELTITKDDDALYVVTTYEFSSERYILIYSSSFYSMGISTIFEQGRRPVIFGDQYLALSPKYSGIRTEVGIFGNNDDLENGFFLKKLAISYMNFEYGFFRYDTMEDFNGEGREYGFEFEIEYVKNSFRYGFLAVNRRLINDTGVIDGAGSDVHTNMRFYMEFTFNVL